MARRCESHEPVKDSARWQNTRMVAHAESSSERIRGRLGSRDFVFPGAEYASNFDMKNAMHGFIATPVPDECDHKR